MRKPENADLRETADLKSGARKEISFLASRFRPRLKFPGTICSLTQFMGRNDDAIAQGILQMGIVSRLRMLAGLSAQNVQFLPEVDT